MNADRTKVMLKLRQLFPEQIMVHQEHLKNAKHFKYLGSKTTNGARCTSEIKSRIVMAKNSIQQEED